MGNKIKKYLFDLKESVFSIENYFGEKSDFNVYMKNKMMRRAVERELIILIPKFESLARKRLSV